MNHFNIQLRLKFLYINYRRNKGSCFFNGCINAAIIIQNKIFSCFFKHRHGTAKICVFIKHKWCTVKYNLCLAANGVAIKHWQPVLNYIQFYNCFAFFIMQVIKWRSTDVYHHIRLLLNQHIHRANAVQKIIAYIPDVFANSQRNFFSFELDHIPIKRWFKIPILIKHIIRWQ